MLTVVRHRARIDALTEGALGPAASVEEGYLEEARFRLMALAQSAGESRLVRVDVAARRAEAALALTLPHGVFGAELLMLADAIEAAVLRA